MKVADRFKERKTYWGRGLEKQLQHKRKPSIYDTSYTFGKSKKIHYTVTTKRYKPGEKEGKYTAVKSARAKDTSRMHVWFGRKPRKGKDVI